MARVSGPLLPEKDPTLSHRTFRIADADWEELKVVAGRYQRTPSDVIRYLVQNFLDDAADASRPQVTMTKR